MPPDPILALLCFIGLTIYMMIGVTIGTVSCRAFGYHKGEKAWYDSNGSETFCEAPITFSALLWPAWLGIVAAGASIFAVFAGPVWLCGRVHDYVAAIETDKKAEA